MRARVNQAMKQIAQDLRQRQTPAETIMWEALRNRRLDGLKFRRQHPIPNTSYVVDFFCHESMLVVEIDGGVHETQVEDDAIRQANIEAEGYTVLRFANEDVYHDLEGVLTVIISTVREEQVPSPHGRGDLGVREITKWDIFYYVYALLHHPQYRERYGDSLKRELPRIPFVDEFHVFAEAGKKLAELHLHYEDVKGYRLVWKTKTPVSYRVEKMRLKGKTNASDEKKYAVYDTLVVNDTLTMTGIPEAAFDYRLGNRSALEWIVDQYQVKTDKRSGIVSDPNQYSDDERYIVDLVEKVIQVSVETVAIVNELAGYEIA